MKAGNKRKITLAIVIIALCTVAAGLMIAFTAADDTYIRIDKEKISRPKYEYFFHVNRMEYGEIFSNLMTGMGNSGMMLLIIQKKNCFVTMPAAVIKL